MKIIRSATPDAKTVSTRLRPWKLLVVDDEPDVRSLTRLNLKGFAFADRELEILEAGSAAEARTLLAEHRDIAVALIDVVMESDDAGLKLVEHIRDRMGNDMLRIIIRTGQPGMAPERFVIDHYDIDDYKDKTELTAQRLYTTVRSALKAFRDLRTIDLNRHGLAGILEVAPEIYRISNRPLNEFFQGILTQIIGLCNLDDSTFLSTIDGMVATIDGREIVVQAKSDTFPTGERYEEIRRLCTEAVLTGNVPAGLRTNAMVLPLRGRGRPLGFIFVEPTAQLTEQDRSLLEVMSYQCSIALENLRLHMNMLASHDNAVDMLAEIAEFKDKSTGEHIARIDTYTRMVATELGIPKEQAEIWGKASRLHDVGKIGIPDQILSKPGPLATDEFETMQRHTDIGAFILRHDQFFDLAREVAYSHHERWDGTGYPLGRPSREFSLVTRIVSVVDVFDALVSRRPYKDAWSAERAIATIEAGAGSQFDPDVVRAFAELYRRGELDHIIRSATRPDEQASPS